MKSISPVTNIIFDKYCIPVLLKVLSGKVDYLLLFDDGGPECGDEGCEELALLVCRVLFRLGDESGVDGLPLARLFNLSFSSAV